MVPGQGSGRRSAHVRGQDAVLDLVGTVDEVERARWSCVTTSTARLPRLTARRSRDQISTQPRCPTKPGGSPQERRAQESANRPSRTHPGPARGGCTQARERGRPPIVGEVHQLSVAASNFLVGLTVHRRACAVGGSWHYFRARTASISASKPVYNSMAPASSGEVRWTSSRTRGRASSWLPLRTRDKASRCMDDRVEE